MFYYVNKREYQPNFILVKAVRLLPYFFKPDCKYRLVFI